MGYGAAAGAALQVLGGIASGIAASKEAKRRNKELARLKMDNENWFNREYSEDVTARADAQRAITHAEEVLRNRNAAAAGTAAVMGGSNEAVVAAQDSGNRALAEVASRIAAAGEERKAQAEREYREQKSLLAGQELEMAGQRNQARAQAMQGVFSAAGNIASSLDDFSTGENKDKQKK